MFSNLSYMEIKHKNERVVRSFNEPLGIGYISVDARRQLHYDRSQMRYFVPRDTRYGLSLDLNAGYYETIQKTFNLGDTMNETLNWIVHSRRRPSADFVTGRGTLAKILCTPYLRKSSNQWTICASKYKGVIYFAEVETESNSLNKMLETEKDRQMSAWGLKFEAYMTSVVPWGSPDLTSRTHQLETFSIMLTNRLNNHTFLYRAETDGMDSSRSNSRPEDTSCYVELKTSKAWSACPTSFLFQKVKSLQWWAQSHLAGVPLIVCGLRDDLGIVTSIVSYRTENLPKLCQSQWSPEVCFNFCDDFVNFLKEKLLEDDHRVVYKLDYKCNSIISCEKLSYPEERYRVIPDWFVDDMNKLQ